MQLCMPQRYPTNAAQPMPGSSRAKPEFAHAGACECYVGLKSADSLPQKGMTQH